MGVAVKNHALPVQKKNRIASLLCNFETIIYSFVIEGHLVEWLFQLKVYASLNIV